MPMERDGVIELKGLEHFSEDRFFEFCQTLRIEREADRTVLIKRVAGFRASNLFTKINREFYSWTKIVSIGEVVGSNTGFLLKDGSMRSPSAGWISDQRLQETPLKSREKFLPACPNFIVEVLSPFDSLERLTRKMDLWLQNGVEVGWLINPETEEVTIYEAGKSPFVVKGFDQSIDCPHLLPGFVFDLRLLRLG
jgi:Uma2 family endonuclease